MHTFELYVVIRVQYRSIDMCTRARVRKGQQHHNERARRFWWAGTVSALSLGSPVCVYVFFKRIRVLRREKESIIGESGKRWWLEVGVTRRRRVEALAYKYAAFTSSLSL